MRAAGVYRITNTVNGRKYYGSSTNMEARYAQHLMHLARGKHHNAGLQSDYDQHGLASLRFEPLVVCDPEEIRELESKLIERMQGEEIYNSKHLPRPAVQEKAARRRGEVAAAYEDRLHILLKHKAIHLRK